MKDSPQRRTTFQPEDIQEILDARVEKVIIVRRAIIADLRAVEDRIRRLGMDIRRLLSGRPAGYGHGLLLPPIIAAVEKQRRLVDFEGVTDISKGGMLRVFLDAVDFAREARGVLAFCERVVRKWGLVWPGRDEECFEEIYKALSLFPGLGIEGGGGDDDGRRKNREESRIGERGMVTEGEILRRLVDEVEVVPFRGEGSLRWGCCSAYE